MSAAATLSVLEKEGILPKPFAQKIISRAIEQSVVQRLAQKTPMPITGASIAVQTGQPQAGVVGDGQLKPVSNATVKTKYIKPIKVATVMYWSMEARQANPAGYIQFLEEQAAGAISRAFDLAVLYGKDALTGTAITGVESVNQTTNRVKLGTAKKEAGGLSADLLAGTDLITLNENFDFDVTGFAAHKSMKSQLVGQTDTLGRPIYAEGFDITKGTGSILGAPVAFGSVVSGKVGANADTKVRAFAGDWSQLSYGFVEDMTVKRSDQATIMDGSTPVYLWQQNMEAMILEAQFGWVITDPAAFTAYEEKAA